MAEKEESESESETEDPVEEKKKPKRSSKKTVSKKKAKHSNDEEDTESEDDEKPNFKDKKGVSPYFSTKKLTASEMNFQAWVFAQGRPSLTVFYCTKCAKNSPKAASLDYDKKGVKLSIPLCIKCAQENKNIQSSIFKLTKD